MKQVLKIVLALLVVSFVAGVAQAQEAPFSQKFASESSSMNPMVENLSKLKNGVGIRFSSDAMFGISVNKGVKVGFKVKF